MVIYKNGGMRLGFWYMEGAAYKMRLRKWDELCFMRTLCLVDDLVIDVGCAHVRAQLRTVTGRGYTFSKNFTANSQNWMMVCLSRSNSLRLPR